MIFSQYPKMRIRFLISSAGETLIGISRGVLNKKGGYR